MGEQENADIKHIGSLPSLICASIKSSGVYKVKKKDSELFNFLFAAPGDRVSRRKQGLFFIGEI